MTWDLEMLRRAMEEALTPFREAGSALLDGRWQPESQRPAPARGPSAAIVDLRFEASFAAAGEIVAVAFLRTAEAAHWVKCGPPAASLGVSIVLSRYADRRPPLASVACSIGRGCLPVVPVPAGEDLPASLRVATGAHPLGTLRPLLRAPPLEFLALLLPGPAVRMGRNRLWRLREEQAAALPGPLRSLLTRGRAGHLPR